jgi:hypothetical protein
MRRMRGGVWIAGIPRLIAPERRSEPVSIIGVAVALRSDRPKRATVVLRASVSSDRRAQRGAASGAEDALKRNSPPGRRSGHRPGSGCLSGHRPGAGDGPVRGDPVRAHHGLRDRLLQGEKGRARIRRRADRAYGDAGPVGRRPRGRPSGRSRPAAGHGREVRGHHPPARVPSPGPLPFLKRLVRRSSTGLPS